MIKPTNPFRSVFGVLFLIAAGCATSGGSGGEVGGRSPERDVLTEADLEGMDQLSVYEAVRRLKPNWFRYRGQSVLVSPEREGLRVYLDGSFFGDAESVQAIMVQNIQEIRFLDARQATLRFGTGHTVGALLLTSKKA